MPHNPTISEDVVGVFQNTFLCPFTTIHGQARTSTGNDGKNTVFVYVGTSGIPAKNASIRFLMQGTTISGAISWAEMGIFRGTFSLLGNASLTKLGVASIEPLLYSSNAFQGGAGSAAGDAKSINISLDPPIRPGDDIWYGYGISAGTMPNFVRTLNPGGSQNDISTGIVQLMVPATKPSNLTGPFTTTGVTANSFINSGPIFAYVTIY